ncbi:hypothetical protein [Pseudobutyrivibrio sp. MD2005]|uniref:hypothetical protein n=1 Tax=Pseudobutyrivibrio sp. MD2005 TaxID=1410616 RepID=UPI000485800F|nr:hypothetical protein [Pseudobutyrivibrio sp. MD2005]
MKSIKNRLRIFASVFLISAIVISYILQTTITANAADSAFTLEDESFIPSRSFYPYYISIYSSCKSDLIKGMWERILFEENNFNSYNNKGMYSSWASEYYAGADTNYISTKGASVSWQNINFSTNTGDFDIFLGNSLEANPEMLGEILGLKGYTAVSSKTGQYSQASLLDTYRKIIYNKLANPASFKGFAQSMVRLTKDGKYLNDGALKSASYNGKSFDYWMLCTLAAFYEGDGSETYLSPTQVTWLEGYTNVLLNEYINSRANAFNGTSWVPAGTSLAGKYQPIYNLIARSSAGVNNNSKNKEFFNYVVASGKGAGAWLNKHNSINIANLNNVDDIVSLFTFSDGWCGGLCASANCYSHTASCHSKDNCKRLATANDIIAVQLHRNSVADGFIKSNTKLLSVYGANGDTPSSWQYRHKIKHTQLANNSNSILKAIDAANGNVASGELEDMDGGQEWINLHSTAVIDLSKVLANSNSPQSVTITFWYTDGTNNNNTEKDYDNTTKWEASSNNVTIVNRKYLDYTGVSSEDVSEGNKYQTDFGEGYPAMYAGNENPATWYKDPEKSNFTYTGYRYKSYEFDISNLSESELRNGWIKVTNCSQIHGTRGDEYGGTGPMHIVTVADKINDCDINGHKWIVKNNSDVVWAKDYSKVSIMYTCDKKVSEKQQYVAQTTSKKSADGKYITYTAKGIDGKTYTRVVNSTAGAAGVTKTINISTNNVNGTSPTDYDKSSSVVWPGGSKSTTIYTQSTSRINFTIQNQIPAGTQKVQFYYYASENLRELNIEVLSNGKIIGQGGLNKPSTFDSKNGIVTIPLIQTTDEDLNNCYVRISGESHTQHVVPSSTTPSTSISTIGITKMVLYF